MANEINFFMYLTKNVQYFVPSKTLQYFSLHLGQKIVFTEKWKKIIRVKFPHFGLWIVQAKLNARLNLTILFKASAIRTSYYIFLSWILNLFYSFFGYKAKSLPWLFQTQSFGGSLTVWKNENHSLRSL